MEVKDKVALITGAGSGIGRALAISLAKRGCHSALVDIQADGLKETAALLTQWNVESSEHVLDVRDRASILALPRAVIWRHGRLDQLINNAGVAVSGRFLQIREADFDWMMDINFHAVVRLTRIFLPYLQKRPEAMIVNISSVFGLIAPAGHTAYSASKFAVRGFSNALRHELDGSHVRVCVVHPGGVATQIASNSRVAEGLTAQELAKKQERAKKLLRMLPERAGEIIVRGIQRNKARILVGADAKLLAALERLMPVNYWKVLKSFAKLRGELTTTCKAGGG